MIILYGSSLSGKSQLARLLVGNRAHSEEKGRIMFNSEKTMRNSDRIDYMPLDSRNDDRYVVRFPTVAQSSSFQHDLVQAMTLL